jgi:DNA polymerase-3 subunit epsilon
MTQKLEYADHCGHAPSIDEAERMATLLEATQNYRVLRRLRPPIPSPARGGAPVKRAVVVDVETTGLDHAQDEVIELAMAAFEYGADGFVGCVSGSFVALRDPGRPISTEVTRITGITDSMVANKAIDSTEIENFLSGTALVIAHNASFDRPFCERLCARFATLNWACSFREVPWTKEGHECAKLGHLAISNGMFFDAHRALDDCLALVAILSRPLPRSGRTGLACLLETARRRRWRIRAVGAPFASRELLKSRGYRWETRTGFPRAWHIDVNDEELERESSFLRTTVYHRADAYIDATAITAVDRYSARC